MTADDARSAAALGERCAAFARRLELLLAHLAGPRVRAAVELDDLVQETLLRALRAGDRAPPPERGDAELWRWLAAIAKHAVIDQARALRAQRRDGTTERLERSSWTGGVDVPLRAPGPATAAAAQEDGRAWVAAFRRLSPEHRRVLGLRQFEGLSARDAARRMGRSETAVHSLYRRALEAWELERSAFGRRPRDESGAARR